MRPTSGARWVSAAKTVRWTVFASGVAQSASGASREAKLRDTRRRPAQSDNPEVGGIKSGPCTQKSTSATVLVDFTYYFFTIHSSLKTVSRFLEGNR